MPAIIDLELSGERLDDLAGYLHEKFAMVVKARSSQIDDKALMWEKNYAAIPMQEIRTTPFYRASNFMPQLIRMHSDILSARVLGILFGTKPFWKVKAPLIDSDIPHDLLDSLEAGLNYISETDLCWFETVDQIVNQSFQTGTLIEKGIWNEETKSRLRGDRFEEYSINQLEYCPVPFEDFWPYPITAPNVCSAEILFHRIRLTERSVRERVAQGRWSQNADMMFQETANDPLADARAEDSGIMLTADVAYPFTAVEAWFDYSPNGTTSRPVVVVFNPQIRGRGSILRAYYNFLPSRPFHDFRPIPRKGSFYGYSVPEVLEQSQEEAAQIHNARRDANTIANIPGWKKKRYADVPNPSTDWYPGCVIELDEMDDLEPLQFGLRYDSMIDEEQYIESLAERYIGISPAMQGFGAGQAAGKRGVYATGATLALLSEGNQRLDIYIRRLRYPFHRIGDFTLACYRDLAPDAFSGFGKRGEAIKAALELTDQRGRFLYQPSASDASANREIDRQNLLQMANTMAAYYERIVQGSGMLQQIPQGDPMREILFMVLDGARDLAQRLLFAFDIGDRDKLLPDATQVLGGGAGQAGPAGPGGLPGAQGAVQPPQLEDILARLSAVQG